MMQGERRRSFPEDPESMAEENETEDTGEAWSKSNERFELVAWKHFMF